MQSYVTQSIDSGQIRPESTERGAISPKSSINSSRKKSRLSKDPGFAHFQGMGWLSVILKGPLPEKRANMGYCADSHYFYILGGQDLNKGLFNTLWRISLQAIRDNIKNAVWEELENRGEPPKCISHCCMFVYQGKLFVFGGSNPEEDPYSKLQMQDKKIRRISDEANKVLMFNVLNQQTLQWSAWRQDDTPEVDDCAHFFDQKTGTLWAFGGYMNGLKSNIFFSINVNTRVVTILNQDTPSSHSDAHKLPCQRSGSRLAFDSEKRCFYLFGGLTMINETLSDMWQYQVDDAKWVCVKQKGEVPHSRCGHSLHYFSDKLFLFGGLLEVTQESSETFKFDINTQTWEQIGGNHHSPSTRVTHLLEGYSNLKKQSLMDVNSFSRGETPNSVLKPSSSNRSISRKHSGSTSQIGQRSRLNNLSNLQVNDMSVLSGGRHRMNQEQFKVFETHRAMTELRHIYTKSCRDIVSGRRKSPNPRPGPIPAPLSLSGVMHRKRLSSACNTGRRQISVG